VSVMFFDPKVNGPTALSYVHFAAFTGDLVYAWCF
jgi:hypothetical protein